MCFVHGRGQKREQKNTTKNFAWFHNHSPLLTMITLTFVSIMYYYRDLSSNAITSLPDGVFSNQRWLKRL